MMPAPMGHNRPPSEMEILKERLDGYAEQKEQIKRLAAVVLPDEISDEAQAGTVTQHIKNVKIFQKGVAEIHKKEKAIFLECGRVVDNWKNEYEGYAKNLIDQAMAPLDAFLRKKAEEERKRQLEIARKAREDAEKLAKEAAAHAVEGIDDTADELLKAAHDSDLKADLIQSNAHDTRAKARSFGGGASASQKKTWKGRIVSRAAIDVATLLPYFTDADLQKALDAFVRDGGRELRGAVIEQVTSIQVR